MVTRADARYTISADDSGSQQAFNRVRRSLNGLGESARRLAGPLALGALGAAAISTARDVLMMADELTKAARDLGVSTEFLSEMRFVLEQSGGDFDSFTRGLTRLSGLLGRFRAGVEGAEKVFEEFGLEALRDVGVEEAFEIIGERIAGLRAAGRTEEAGALAQAFYGRGGAETFIREAEANTDRLRGVARDLGQSFSQEQGEAAERTLDALNTLENAWQGLREAAILEYAEPVAEAMVAVTNAILGMDDALAALRRQFEGTAPPGWLTDLASAIPGVGAARALRRLREAAGGAGREGSGGDRFTDITPLLQRIEDSNDIQRSIERNTRDGGATFR